MSPSGVWNVTEYGLAACAGSNRGMPLNRSAGTAATKPQGSLAVVVAGWPAAGAASAASAATTVAGPGRTGAAPPDAPAPAATVTVRPNSKAAATARRPDRLVKRGIRM